MKQAGAGAERSLPPLYSYFMQLKLFKFYLCNQMLFVAKVRQSGSEAGLCCQWGSLLDSPSLPFTGLGSTYVQSKWWCQVPLTRISCVALDKHPPKWCLYHLLLVTVHCSSGAPWAGHLGQLRSSWSSSELIPTVTQGKTHLKCVMMKKVLYFYNICLHEISNWAPKTNRYFTAF